MTVRSAPKLSLRKRVTFTLLLLILALGLAEAGLQFAASWSPRVRIVLAPSWVQPRLERELFPPIIPDPVLGHRLNPDLDQHDERGFRNACVPQRVDVVVLGDSQTYGSNVNPRESWPSCVAQLTGRTTYNLGVGGYGAAHYVVLLPEALALKPKLALIAFYTGNDLYDCYHLVHVLGAVPELRDTDAELVAAAAAQEATDPIKPHTMKLHRLTAGRRAFEGRARPPAGPPPGLRTFVSYNVKLYGLLRAAKDRLAPPPSPAAPTWSKLRGSAYPCHRVAFETANFRTLLTPTYRLFPLDPNDPRIHIGNRIMRRAIGVLQRELSAHDVEFIAVLIPTKELVAAALDEAAVRADAAADRLIDCERQARASWKRTLEELGVPCIDVLPALAQAAGAGQQPYPIGTDGHPNDVGHRVIAEAIARALGGAQQLAASD